MDAPDALSSLEEKGDKNEIEKEVQAALHGWKAKEAKKNKISFIISCYLWLKSSLLLSKVASGLFVLGKGKSRKEVDVVSCY